MSPSRRPASLVEALDDLNKGLTKAQRDAANEVAKVAKPALLAEALHHRGTLSMSGMNISRLTVSSKVLSTPTHSTVIVRPGRMAGAVGDHRVRHPHRFAGPPHVVAGHGDAR